MPGTDLARRKPGVQIPSPPPPTSQVRASPASSGRRSVHACGRAAAASPSQSAAQWLRGQPTQPQTSHNDHTAWSPPATSTGNPCAHPAPLTVDLAHCQPPPTTTTKSTLCWPSTACASFERQTPTSGRRPTVVDIAGHHPDPGHPSRAAAGPTAIPRDLIPVGHRGRRNARTPDAGHWTPGLSDARTGHRTRGQAPVEHRTLAPDTNADTVTTAQPASG